jgi:hypothetical protein
MRAARDEGDVCAGFRQRRPISGSNAAAADNRNTLTKSLAPPADGGRGIKLAASAISTKNRTEKKSGAVTHHDGRINLC